MTGIEYWLSKQRWLKEDLSPDYLAFWEARDNLSTALDDFEPWVYPSSLTGGRGKEGLLAWWRSWLYVLKDNPTGKAGYWLCLEEMRKLMGGT